MSVWVFECLGVWVFETKERVILLFEQDENAAKQQRKGILSDLLVGTNGEKRDMATKGRIRQF